VPRPDRRQVELKGEMQANAPTPKEQYRNDSCVEARHHRA
jgi:hypothetical protein